MTVLFAGDPHRNFSPIIRACETRSSGDLVIVGDLDCPDAVTSIFSSVLSLGWRLHWILGNHDCETEVAFDNLVMDYPEGALGWCVKEIGGWRIAGLPGVFKPSVWEPPALPLWSDSARFRASLPSSRSWRQGLPLWHRDTIFPDDFNGLAGQRFDILVSHEAPSSHPHGYAAIDDLAAAGGARLIVHGHHHQSYRATLPNGIAVRGLGLAECWALFAEAG